MPMALYAQYKTTSHGSRPTPLWQCIPLPCPGQAGRVVLLPQSLSLKTRYNYPTWNLTHLTTVNADAFPTQLRVSALDHLYKVIHAYEACAQLIPSPRRVSLDFKVISGDLAEPTMPLAPARHCSLRQVSSSELLLVAPSQMLTPMDERTIRILQPRSGASLTTLQCPLHLSKLI